jgi:hypothetical protein
VPDAAGVVRVLPPAAFAGTNPVRDTKESSLVTGQQVDARGGSLWWTDYRDSGRDHAVSRLDAGCYRLDAGC